MRTRICSRCDTPKEETLENFVFNKTQNKWSSMCRECNKEYQREHYKANKDKYKSKNSKARKENRLANRQKLYSYLLEHPCVDCGEHRIVCLEFDHISDNKFADIAKLINSYSWSKVTEEIEKCEVVCRNCHVIRTATRGGWQKLDFVLQ